MAAITYIVEGGHQLSGSIEPAGNKNAALPIIAAALLSPRRVRLTNVPRIRDTETLVELVRSVGASAEWTAQNTLEIEARDIPTEELDPELCARIRASILLAGPLLARCGHVILPPPGGDVIGRRRVDTHFLAFEQLAPSYEAGVLTLHLPKAEEAKPKRIPVHSGQAPQMIEGKVKDIAHKN